MTRSIAAVLLLALAAPADAASPAAAAQRIGVAAAVAGAVKALPREKPVGRVLGSGQPLFLHEKIVTGPGGRLQILLLDETTFTIGPNAEIVLDEFVYDPAGGKGAVAATISKGAFRFITGKVARRDPASMKVKTGVATIGIRGTMVAGSTGGGETTVVLLGPGPANNAGEKTGACSVGNDAGSVELSQGGFGTTVAGSGAPSAPVEFTQEQIDAITGDLGGPAGSGGGDGSAQEGSASEASGESTAAGGAQAAETGDVGALVSALDQQSSVASQDVISSGGSAATSWADILAIPSGQGHYLGTGSATCTGGGCDASSGSFNIHVGVDFGNKTLLNDGFLNATSLYSGASTNFNSMSFASFTGDAVYTLQSSDLSNSNFSGTSLKFSSADGTAAGSSLTVDLQFDASGSAAITGTGTAQYEDNPL